MTRDKISMNDGWRFYEGEIGGVRNRWGKSGSWNQGPESADYDDSGWREVELPHDFVIESSPYEYSVQEFGSDNAIPDMDTVKNIHTTAGSFKKDAGWYRRHFYVDEKDFGRRIYIAFDGVYRASSVYVNNFFVGRHQSGYTLFEYDISDFLNYGGDNVIVVYVDARAAEGWFYEGGGIYRNVWLYKTAPVHIKDVYVKAVPAVSSQFGLMDLSGNQKDGYYYFRALYRDEPLIHIAHSWNGIAGEKMDIAVFTNCHRAELFVNGKSLGKREKSRFGYLTWTDVEYEPGELRAVGDDGTVEDIVVTPGAAAGIKLRLEYFHNDIMIVNTAIVDNVGNVVPDADCDLQFRADIMEKDKFDDSIKNDTAKSGAVPNENYVVISCKSANGFNDALYVPCSGEGLKNEAEYIAGIRLLGTSSGYAADHVVPGSDLRRSFNGLAQAIFKVYNKNTTKC